MNVLLAEANVDYGKLVEMGHVLWRCKKSFDRTCC